MDPIEACTLSPDLIGIGEKNVSSPADRFEDDDDEEWQKEKS